MYGGGMFNNNSSNPVLTNVTFSSNQAAMSGGGMQNNSSNPVLTNVTFSANQATNPTFGSAGGMFNGNSSPIIRNTLFWGNTAPNGSTSEQQISDFGNTPNVDYSVVEGGYASGTNIISTDPNLGALNWYGGFTITVPLLPGSSAIDATSSNCPFYDQRGMGRSWPTCDIGAFEYPDFFPDAPRIDTPTENSYTQLLRPLISGTAGSAQAYATVTVKEVAATICTTTAALDGSWSCTPGADLSEALHTISVTQTDLSTQESIASTLSFTVDATAPSAPRIDMPTENSYINGGMPLISGTAGAAEAYATVTVNEDSATLCSAVADVDGSWICAPGANLSEGLHTISVTQTDLANNTSLASTRNFTVDMTNPSAPRIDTPAAGSYTNLVRPLISGTAGAAEANATVTVNEDSATLCSTVADVDGSWSCSPGKDLSGGLHTISVTQTDLANNTSLASTRSFTIPYLVYLPVARH
jgi:hypothetical protein